jgi:hypothetical protein
VIRHNGKRPPKCDHVKGGLHCGQCEFKTIYQDSLNKHKREHTKLGCDLSEFITDHPMYLSSRKRREHHGNPQPTIKADEPVLCKDCGKRYNSKKSLDKHIKRRHLP